MPRVAAVEKSEQVKQKERKKIEEYKALVADITQRVSIYRYWYMQSLM